jgi:hypothetical protein
MAANPRVVTEAVTITWDGAPQRLAKGQIVDVPAGSALEAAIGEGNLRPMFRAGSTMIVPEPPAAAPAQAPAGRKKSGQSDPDSSDGVVP